MSSVGEASLLAGPDQTHYLFYSGFREGEGAASIGWAKSTDGPFGPYVRNRRPIIQSVAGSYDEDDVIAPSVLADGHNVRMWYTALDEHRDDKGNHLKAPSFQIAYTNCPGFLGGTQEFTELIFDDFQNGFGNFTDGGANCAHFSSDTFNSIEIKNASGQESSFWNTDGFDLETPGFTQLKVEFSYFPQDMEDEDGFWLLYFNGRRWDIVESFGVEKDFQNEEYKSTTVIIRKTDVAFPTDAKIMFGCNADDTLDRVHIDKVKVSAR